MGMNVVPQGYTPVAPQQRFVAPQPGYYQPAAYAQDAYRPIAVQNPQAVNPNGSTMGLLAGLAGGIFVALPKLARFGPVGVLTGAVVVIACGWYGKQAGDALEALTLGAPRAACEVASWGVGAGLAASVVVGMAGVSPLGAAALIWAGSWAGGFLFNAIWPQQA